MSGFVIQLTSIMCLLVILTGPVRSAAPPQNPFTLPPPPQTYPSDPNDPYYQGKLFHSHPIYLSWVKLDKGISFVKERMPLGGQSFAPGNCNDITTLVVNYR